MFHVLPGRVTASPAAAVSGDVADRWLDVSSLPRPRAIVASEESAQPAMRALDPRIPADLLARLRAKTGLRFGEPQEIAAGQNNRLFALAAPDGTRVLAKLYFRDDRRRLEREFRTLAFLAERRLGGVPRALIRNDELGYGVYSFESGQTMAPAELTAGEAARIGRFTAELHRITPDDPDAAFPPAVISAFSLAEQVALIRARLEEFLASPAASADDAVRAFCGELDVVATIEELIRAATADLPADEVAAGLPRGRWRLSNGDFGVHNVLIRPDGGFSVLDWEYSGWDDPARHVQGFLCHAATDGISPAAAEAFVATYARTANLSEAELERHERVRRLYEIEWATIHLSAMTERRIRARQFAIAGFDLDDYLSLAIRQFKARVERARTLLDR